MSQAQSCKRNESQSENELRTGVERSVKAEQELSTHGIRVDLFRSGSSSISSATEDNEVVIRTDPPCPAYLLFSLVYLQFSLVGDRKVNGGKKEAYGKVLDGQLLLELNTRDQPTDSTHQSVFSPRLAQHQELENAPSTDNNDLLRNLGHAKPC